MTLQIPRIRPLAVVVAVAMATGPVAHAAAQTTPAEPVRTEPLFTSFDLVALASFAALTIAITPADQEIATRVQDSLLQKNTWLQRSAAVVREVATPGSIIIGSTLYIVGSAGGNERMAELGLHGLEALAVGGGVTYALKGLIGRARPYKDVKDPRNFGLWRGFTSHDYRSFPSGHTVMAFAAAAAVTGTTDKWWPNTTWYLGPALFGGAALAGVSRMYNNQHWASDVVVGAAIGTFAGIKVMRYHTETNPDNWIDRTFLSISLPVDERGAGAMRFSLVPAAAVAPLSGPR
jgi:membrane-associated phospholipid phosphatase